MFQFLFGAGLPPPDPSNPDEEYDLKQPVPLFIAPLSAQGAAALSVGAGASSEPHVNKFLGIKINDDVFAELDNVVRRA